MATSAIPNLNRAECVQKLTDQLKASELYFNSLAVDDPEYGSVALSIQKIARLLASADAAICGGNVLKERWNAQYEKLVQENGKRLLLEQNIKALAQDILPKEAHRKGGLLDRRALRTGKLP